MRFCIAFIFLLGLFSIKGQNTDFNSVADDYLQSGDYANALVEYERIAFEKPSVSLVNEALFKKAFCYKQLGNFQMASKTLSRILLFGLSQNELNDYFYEKILCSYLSGDFNEAATTIDEMYATISSETDANPSLLLQVLVYNELTDWKKAKDKAKEWVNVSFPCHEQDSLCALIEKRYARPPKLKKERTAKILAFVPGLGHIYAGYWGEGLVSFTLNAAVLSFGVYQAWYGYYITAYLGGAGALSTTFFGNLYRAEYLVGKRNYKKIRAFNDEARVFFVLLNE